MATKKEIIADLKGAYGQMLNAKQVGEYLGLCPKATKAFMDGVPSFRIGRQKCYFPVDVANRLLAAEE
jgi:hypothetical protein